MPATKPNMPAENGPGDGAADGGPEVRGTDETGAGFPELDRLVDLARTTLVGEGVTTGHLDLLAVDRDEMAALNAEHMGHDGPTDVLSFPLDADEALAAPGPADGPPLHLGDVVICPEVARAQAPEHCGSEEAELSLLVIHGVLHVLGHDHAEPDERDRMWARERHHLAAIGHTHPEGSGVSW